MNVRKLFYLLVSVLCLQSVSATDFTVPRLSPFARKGGEAKDPFGRELAVQSISGKRILEARKCYQLEKYRSARRMGNARL